MSQRVGPPLNGGIYLQHGSQEGKTIPQVSTLCLYCLSPLTWTDGGSHTEQDEVHA